MGSIHAKNRGRKSRDTVPLKCCEIIYFIHVEDQFFSAESLGIQLAY